MALLATSALAACSSGSTEMLPTNPQTQSVPQTPNRAARAVASGTGMHTTLHTPNGSDLLVGMNPATGQNPTGSIGRAHADDKSSGGGTCGWQNFGSQGSCQGSQGGGGGYDPGPPQYGGGGGTPCQGMGCVGQPCYTGEGGPGCVATVSNNQQCYSAPVKNTPIGSGGHDNSISNVFVDSLDTNGAFTVIGYEYQTYGGKEYWQFAGQLSVGVSGGISFVSVSAGASLNAPIVPYSGNLSTDLGESLSSMGDSAAMPFNAVGLLSNIISAAGSNSIVRADCYAGS